MMGLSEIGLCVLCLLFVATTGHGGRLPLDEERVHMELLQKYYKDVKPPGTLDVSFGLTLQQFVSLDPRTDILTLNVWHNMAWKDPRLAWNESFYGGIKSIRLPLGKIWFPDIFPYNSVMENVFNPDHMAVVSSSGDILVVPPFLSKTTCTVDLTRFPFDEQICKVKFGSWTYDGSQISLKQSGSSVDTSSMLKNKEWDLVKTEMKRNVVKYECCPEEYVDITARLYIRRRSDYNACIFVVPAVLLALLVPFIFLLPAGTGEKTTLGVGILVTLVLLLTMLEDYLPLMHDTIPLISRYYVTTFVLMCISTAVSALLSSLSNRVPRGSGPPDILKTFLLTCVGKMLCVSYDPLRRMEELHVSMHSLEHRVGTTPNADGMASDTSNIVEEFKTRRGPVGQWEYQLIATVLDRLFFLIFSVIAVICTIAYLVY